jgi:hypothetical protein
MNACQRIEVAPIWLSSLLAGFDLGLPPGRCGYDERCTEHGRRSRASRPPSVHGGVLVSTGSWDVGWRAEPRARKTGKNIGANSTPAYALAA